MDSSRISSYTRKYGVYTNIIRQKYDNYTSRIFLRISSYTSRISPVFRHISSYTTKYEHYTSIIRLVYEKIRQLYDSYFLPYFEFTVSYFLPYGYIRMLSEENPLEIRENTAIISPVEKPKSWEKNFTKRWQGPTKKELSASLEESKMYNQQLEERLTALEKTTNDLIQYINQRIS